MSIPLTAQERARQLLEARRESAKITSPYLLRVAMLFVLRDGLEIAYARKRDTELNYTLYLWCLQHPRWNTEELQKYVMEAPANYGDRNLSMFEVKAIAELAYRVDRFLTWGEMYWGYLWEWSNARVSSRHVESIVLDAYLELRASKQGEHNNG